MVKRWNKETGEVTQTEGAPELVAAQVEGPAIVTMPDAPADQPAPHAKVGGNSVGTLMADGQLRSLVERVERLEEEKKALADDIREVYSEAKGAGFDTKILRRVIQLRKMDPNDRSEMDAVMELYMSALGMR